MSFTQHFAAISQVFSDCMHICSFQQCQYCEIGNVSMGFSKSLMPKILYKSLVFDSWFDKIFGICDLENPILTFPPHSIVSLFVWYGVWAVRYSYIEICAVISNTPRWGCGWLAIRRSKNDVYLIILWDHLEKNTNSVCLFVCLFDLSFDLWLSWIHAYRVISNWGYIWLAILHQKEQE